MQLKSDGKTHDLAACGGIAIFVVCAIMWWKLLVSLASSVLIGGSIVHYFKKGKQLYEEMVERKDESRHNCKTRSSVLHPISGGTIRVASCEKGNG